MSKKNNKKDYPPNDRTFLKPSPSDLESHSESGPISKLPDNTKDPIVCNNIAFNEFNYTESLDDSHDI